MVDAASAEKERALETCMVDDVQKCSEITVDLKSRQFVCSAEDTAADTESNDTAVFNGGICQSRLDVAFGKAEHDS